MKTILLHTAVTDNGGARRDAGETLTIGKDAGQITPERAKALVEALGAVDLAKAPAVAAPETPAASD